MNVPKLEPRHLAGIPLFPLPQMVFLPHTTVPLHVFEPRYRALVEHCLENDWPLALAMITPGQEEEHLGRPALQKVAGLGRITHHQEVGDGRFGIIVEGMIRIRIDEELDLPTQFRVARVTLLADRDPEPDVAAAQMHTIRECLAVLGRRVPKLSEALLTVTSQVKDPAVLTDRLGQLIFRNPAHRQRLLETLDVGERLKLVVGRLSALAAGTAHAEDGMAN